MAAELAGSLAVFAQAFAVANDQRTNSTIAVAAKRLAKKQLKSEVRRVARVVRAMCSDPVKLLELGLKAPEESWAPPGPPAEAPKLFGIASSGTQVSFRLVNAQNTARRRRPPGVIGAVIYCHVGPNPAPDPMQWAIVQHTSEMRVTVDLGVRVVPGSMVWVSACWVG